MSARETAAEASLSTSETSMVSRADMNVSSREKATTYFGFLLVWMDRASGGGEGVTLQLRTTFAAGAEI